MVIGGDPVREWVTFNDPDDDDHRWVVDVTFLASNWRCLFGCGCQGVLTEPAPEIVQGCCSYGAHFTGPEDRDRVLAVAAELTSEEWQLCGKGRFDGPTTRVKGGGWRTRLVNGACIFLNRPGFSGGPGCALHLAALRRGVNPLVLKPDVCWQLPLRREDKHTDDGKLTSTLSEFGRDGWGEGGAEFAWWCTEVPETFTGSQPVYRSLEPELRAMVGDALYDRIAAYLDERLGSGSLADHPAVRVNLSVKAR